jgi:hypothetical protein
VIPVDKNGFYRVELQGPDGDMIKASLDYAIDVVEDHAPTVKITKPGRDSRVQSVDEVFTQATASDDFGIQKLEMVYSVNGGPEQTVDLYTAGDRRMQEMTGSHTFMLEDLKLEPGDFISYYARATDNSTTPHTTSSDIYFMNVRPYSQQYRQGEQQQQQQQQQQGQQGQQGQQQSDDPGQMSEQQRQIIAATFKVDRDRTSYTDKEFEENARETARSGQDPLRSHRATRRRGGRQQHEEDLGDLAESRAGDGLRAQDAEEE